MKTCIDNCDGFKSKTSCFDELRYQYIKWYRCKNKQQKEKEWKEFKKLCEEHLWLPNDASLKWLRSLTGR